MGSYSVGYIIAVLTLFSLEQSDGARANVTLQMDLSNDIDPECDETVYKVVVCAGEFTNECQLFGPVARYLQATCAAQGSPEPLSFIVDSVETPIELEVTVQRVGEHGVQRLRRTEFRLIEGGEVSVTSYDLTIIVRFHLDYKCLPNYFGKLCNKFCDANATEHVCDEWGNPICRSGYFIDPKVGKCRQDQCVTNPNYCKNGGTCVANPDQSADHPFCLCPAQFIGPKCEHKQYQTTLTPTIPIPLTANTVQPAIQMSVGSNDLTVTADKGSGRGGNQTATRNNHTNLNQTLRTAHNTLAKNAKHNRIIEPGLNNSHQSTVRQMSNQKSIAQEVDMNILVGSEDAEPVFKRIVLPIFIIILISSLLVTCIGFLVWAVIRGKRKKDSSSSNRKFTSKAASLPEPTKQWATVDQSPNKIYTFDERYFNNPISCIPSPSGTHYAFFAHNPETEPVYGIPMNNSFQPYAKFPGLNQTSSCMAMNNLPWTEDCSHFATLPHPMSTLHRRRTADLGSFFANGPTYPHHNNAFQATGLPDQHARASTLDGASPMQPHCSMKSTGTEHNAQIYVTNQPVVRTPSIRNVGSPMPETNLAAYGSSMPITHSRRADVEHCAHTVSNGNGYRGAEPPTSVPPPPSEFADTYMRSVC